MLVKVRSCFENIQEFFVECANNSTLWYSVAVIVVGILTRKLLQLMGKNENDCLKGENALGLLSDMVIPKRCVKYKRFKSLRGKYHTTVIEISNVPSSTDWQPVLIFCNRKSGANQGSVLLESSRKLLNPIQAHDLCKGPPHATLELCKLLPDVRFRIVICGGDGSANWILTAIYDMRLKTQPLVTVLPLGTGNDLAQCLNWGSGFDLEADTLEHFLVELRSAEEIKVDRWQAMINKRISYFSFMRKSRELSFTSYLSIGCDAQVALGFHEQRQSKPNLFFNQNINKLFYFGFGAKDVIEQQCQELNMSMELWLDGKEVELPYFESLLFLNIPNWGGGCTVWNGSNEWTDTDTSDGKIEVLALTSSFHIAQIQVSLAQPIRLGQAREICLLLKTQAPMQADGEPWRQDPCKIDISLIDQVTMLRRNDKLESDDDISFLQLET